MCQNAKWTRVHMDLFLKTPWQINLRPKSLFSIITHLNNTNSIFALPYFLYFYIFNFLYNTKFLAKRILVNNYLASKNTMCRIFSNINTPPPSNVSTPSNISAPFWDQENILCHKVECTKSSFFIKNNKCWFSIYYRYSNGRGKQQQVLFS